MANIECDRFKAWITSKAEGCLDGDEISDLLKVDEKETECTEEVVFENSEIQNDWETWQAAANVQQSDPSAVKELIAAAKSARIEMLFLAEQTGWREGGSCDKALEALTDSLAKLTTPKEPTL